jgi:Spy/CpxP family protein refolding chaperone
MPIEINHLFCLKDLVMSRLACTLVTLVLALALPGGAAFAREGGPKGPKPQKLERMTRELGLTAEQQGKVKAILDAEHAKKQALHDETLGKLKAVLTKEQFAKLNDKK